MNEELKRTLLQNKSMHLYYSQLADALNAAGWDMRKTLKPDVEIPWTETSVKSLLWKPIQDAMFDKDSTTQLDTKQVSAVYETLNRHTASKLGVSVPFPDRFRYE